MIRSLLAFEWRYIRKQYVFFIACAVFLITGFFSARSGLGGSAVYVNAPYSLTYLLGIASLMAIFLTTAFAASAVLRDPQYGMTDLIFTSNLSKAQFILSRYFGICFPALIALSAIIPGQWLGLVILDIEPEQIGPVALTSYFWPLLVLVLPNILLSGAVLALVAIVARKPVWTYVAGFALYALYFISAIFLNSPIMAASVAATPEAMALGAIFDPFGLSAFSEQTIHWSIAERNSKQVSLSGLFLTNRLLWIAVTGLVLLLTYALFSFRSFNSRKIKKAKPQKTEQTPEVPAYSPVRGLRHGIGAQRAASFSQYQTDLKSVLKSAPFITMILLMIAMLISNLLARVNIGPMGVPSYPVSGMIAGLLGNPLRTFGVFFTIFFAAELAWRHKSYRMQGLVDAAPINNYGLIFPKLAVLTTVILFANLLAILVGILFQLAKGFTDIEVGPYFSTLLFVAWPLILVATLALFVHALVGNKIAAMLISGLIVVLTTTTLAEQIGLEHYMLRYASAPRPQFSDMNNYGPFLAPYASLMLYWTGAAAMLSVLAHGLWNRGTEKNLRERLQGVKAQLTPGDKKAFTAALGLFIASGAYVFHNTNIVNEYANHAEVNAYSAEYEKRYKSASDLPMPTLKSVTATVDIYPSERRYTISGTYRLENDGARPIQKILVGLPNNETKASFSMPNATLAEKDARYAHYWFELDQPLLPGQSTELTYELALDYDGFVSGRPDTYLVENGTFLQSYRHFPLIGYNERAALGDVFERRKHGLPPVEPITRLDETGATDYDNADFGSAWIDFEIIVSTSADQTALAPGYLQKQWTNDGRNYFHYKTENPVRNFFALLSARYDVMRSKENGIDYEVYYHPEHNYNIETFSSTMKASIDYFSTNFSAYQFRQMRVLEFPRYQNFAQAFPNTVPFSEQLGFIMDVSDPDAPDHLSRVLAHEMAHQWWGHQLTPAPVQGETLLSETLSEYSALMVLKKLYGPEMVQEMLRKDLDDYFRFRANQSVPEVPLFRLEGQSYLRYQKGVLVMYALSELIGEQAVNQALSKLLEKKAFKSNNLATSIDLLNELYAVTPAEHHGLIDDWFKRIVLFDLSIEDAAYESSEDGTYAATLEVETLKFRANGFGEEQKITLDQAFDIAIYGAPDEESGENQLLYMGSHQFNQDQTQLILRVDGMPLFAMIDPKVKAIDRNQRDNMREIVAR